MRTTKDSGFEWIGIIPAEWGLSKIGQVYRLRNTKVSDSDYPPLSVTNKGIVPQLNTAAKTNAHDDRKLVKKGDFAINSRSDRRGSCGISDYDGSVSLINTILAPLNEMNPGYYDWLFHTVQFGDEFYKFGHGIVDDLWTTGWQEMKKITIPTPPLPEQQRIADFLDTKCAEIDALTADIQTQIDTLEQYKRSVITETVTKGLNPDAEMKDSGIQWIGDMPAHWGVIRGKYILRYYAKECPQVTATASQIQWALDDGISTMLPVMQSDIMLTRGNEVLIIDAKYYTHTTQTQYDVHTLHSGNLYQIFTYVKNKEAEFGNEPHQVSGMLLYAATDEAIQPDNRYRMSGNQISVKTLDLNRNFSEISAQLNRIVEDHFL